jgi:hypothetical protein
MGTETDWLKAGLVVFAFAIVGLLCFATFVVIRRLIRRQGFGLLGVAVLFCWSTVPIAMMNEGALPHLPEPAKVTPEPPMYAEVAKMVVLKQLRDPDSAKFGNINVYGDRKLKGQNVGVACGSVNSKNGFGGYSGAQKFIIIKQGYQVFFDNSEDNSAFVALWNGLCAGKHS